ncbi:MAG: sugar ABC transporter substrate-binding protein [Anaerolineae bacterium]|nr:sugar ABC transporter substrate-binding protein [Anaerolineae bacterium]
MFRRAFLSLVLSVALLTSLGVVSAQESPVNPWRQFEGTTIVVSWPSLYHFQVAQQLIPEFEELTGITVEVDSVQYESMHDKQVLEMSKPEGDYDVVSWVIFWKTEYVNKGFLTPMAQFFTNPDLVMPDYDAADLIPAYLESGSIVGGRRAYLPGVTDALYGVPFSGETSVLVYRKDIFDQYDLKVPETYDELLDTAEWITANVPDMYGITSRGASGHQIVHAWLLHLSPFGGSVLDDQWNPVVNSEAGVAAAEALKRILDASPPGVTSYGIGEASNSFLQGEAAMFLDNDRIINQTRDPNQSRIDGLIGVALHPTATTCGAETGGFAMGIPSNSRNKEAAFMFIQWMTSKETDRKLASLGGQPSRMSTLLDPEMQAKFPEYAVIAEQLECANVDWRPLIAEWGALNAPILGVQLSEFVTGQKTAQEALDEAARLIREELGRAGYYNWDMGE